MSPPSLRKLYFTNCMDSEKAYAAIIIYLCIVYTDNTVDRMLVSSKTRVAPIKRQTIPKLELLGAVIFSKTNEYCIFSPSTSSYK